MMSEDDLRAAAETDTEEPTVRPEPIEPLARGKLVPDEKVWDVGQDFANELVERNFLPDELEKFESAYRRLERQSLELNRAET